MGRETILENLKVLRENLSEEADKFYIDGLISGLDYERARDYESSSSEELPKEPPLLVRQNAISGKKCGCIKCQKNRRTLKRLRQRTIHNDR